MKKLLFIIALTFILKPVFPVLDYIVNYEYISKTLCENKAKPELKCNGKCHLMKELAKESDIEKPITNNKKEISKLQIEVLFCQDVQSFVSNQIILKKLHSWNTNYSNLYSRLNDCSVFRPPTIIS